VATRIYLLTVGESESMYLEAYGLLLSLLAQGGVEDCPILVGTDHPERYALFESRVSTCRITTEDFDSWRGRHDFFGRAKLVGFRELVGEAGRDHALLLDSDMICRKPVDDLLTGLSSGHAYMHTCEGVLSQRKGGAHLRFYRQFADRAYGTLTVDSTSAMWNSGVVGIPRHLLGIIDEALATYDALMEEDADYHFVEQFALGAHLQASGRLQQAEPWFLHYWGNKPGVQSRLAELVEAIRRDGLDLTSATQLMQSQLVAGRFDLPPVIKRRRWYQKMFSG